ncbi:hypothetical protein CR513_33686, partial [Mucuna pruriens]
MSMVQQMEEIRETIHKLNNELVEKTAKEKSLEEKSLEEKVVQLLHNHEEQKQQYQKMEQQHQQIQLILQHLHLKFPILAPTALDNNNDHGDNA